VLHEKHAWRRSALDDWNGEKEAASLAERALHPDAAAVLLEASGYDVTVAGSLQEAAAAAQASPVDLALIDLTLPDGDGLGLMPHLSGATAVALTGHDSAAVRARCLAAGCVDVLVKPVPVRELIAKAAQWTARARL